MTAHDASNDWNKQPVRTTTGGIPVHAFGDTYVYGVSPDEGVRLKAMLLKDYPIVLRLHGCIHPKPTVKNT